MEMGNFKGAFEYIQRYEQTGYQYNSTGTCWMYTRALLDYKLKPSKRDKFDIEIFRYPNGAILPPHVGNMQLGKPLSLSLSLSLSALRRQEPMA